MQTDKPNTQADAEAAASALATRLGSGWRHQACCSFGGSWDFKAISACGLIEVMPYDDEWLASLYGSGDREYDTEFEGYGPTPEDALFKMKRNARRGVTRMVALLKTAGIEIEEVM